jgi:hypothetical protein
MTCSIKSEAVIAFRKSFTATFTSADKTACGSDTLKIKKFTLWFGEVEKDIYISEAVNVVGDMK